MTGRDDGTLVPDEALLFIFRHEARPGVSDRPHCPGGGSGVTLGPGYDMGARRGDAIRADLTAVGVPPDAARAVAACAGLRGAPAADFARVNVGLVRLDPDQEIGLLARVLPAYARDLAAAVRVPLNANERTALLSFVYNVGSANFRASTLLRRLNAGDRPGAAREFDRWVLAGGRVLPGLVRRRAAERRLFLTPVPAAALA